MPDPAALTSLLARVEAATGADREIDYDLTLCLLGEGWQRMIAAPSILVKKVGERIIDDVTRVAPVTASVDATLALIERVLPGWWWLVRSDETRGAFANMRAPRLDRTAIGADSPSWAATPALALLAAALRALSAQKESADV